MVEIPALRGTAALSREQVREREGELILDRLPERSRVILLDERGERFRSVDWARHLEKHLSQSSSGLVFVIGGSYGFSPAVYGRADARLSLSDMTMSHQLVRLVFLEQLYRAFTILKGEPYHHE